MGPTLVVHVILSALAPALTVSDQILTLSNVTAHDILGEVINMEDSTDLEIIVENAEKDKVDVLKNDSLVNDELEYINMTCEVLIEDTNKTKKVERETVVNKTTNTKDVCINGTCFGWDKYYRLDSIYHYLDYLKQKYPQIVNIITVGFSVENRPIKLVKICTKSNNTMKKGIWVDGGVHAREWITPAASIYIASEVAAAVHSGSSSLSNLTVFVLPVVNPDGYEYSHTHDRFWRKNRAIHNNSDCIGTDLNRNWGFGWGGRDSTANPCSPNFRGIKAFSEPETASVSSFILNTTGIMGYLSLHSYGQNIIFPWGYTYSLTSDYNELNHLAYSMAYKVKNTTGASYKYGSAAESYYVASGGSQDWAKGEAKIKYAYTMELRDKGKHGFSLPPEEIIKTSRDAFSSFTALSEVLTSR